jgi:arginine/lysine/ornithine decarboxylase
LGAPDLLHKGFNAAMRWDLTELDSLDDLHLPRGAIKKAQELAALLFNAEETFFLVNGVTVGLISLFLAFCRPGDKVLLTRISHKAALHGIALSGARPVFLPVEKDSSGFPRNISAAVVRQALQEHPDARLLLVTSPSYWGITADLPAIKQITARHGVIFAVDEAHGTHLPFYGGKLPHSAAAGADIWLHSAHKSLGALTPGAFLHLGKKNLVSPIKFWLQVMQTSSPSYPVMISLDLIRRQMALKGKVLFSRSWNWAGYFRQELEKKGVQLLSPLKKDGFKLDLCRITLFCPRGEGHYLAKRLAQKYRFQVEMCDNSFLLAIVGPSQLLFSADDLARAFSRARRESLVFNPGTTASSIAMDFSPSFFREESKTFFHEHKKEESFPAFCLTPREAIYSPSLVVPLEKSPGKICSEMVVLSPPGIPVLSPGEVITEKVVCYLLQKRAEKTLFQGASDPVLKTIKVVTGDNKI